MTEIGTVQLKNTLLKPFADARPIRAVKNIAWVAVHGHAFGRDVPCGIINP